MKRSILVLFHANATGPVTSASTCHKEQVAEAKGNDSWYPDCLFSFLFIRV